MIDNLIRSNNKNLAKEWIDRSFKEYKNRKHKYMHLLYQRKAEWYFEEGKRDSAYHYFKRADSIARANDKDIDPINQLKYAITKDRASFIQDAYQKAKEHYLKNNNEVMVNRAKMVLII
jgi:tetratricopeptide (TPR) repeat protein